MDTRLAPGPNGGPALAAGETRILTLTGTCGVPSNALGLVVNLTAIDPAASGFTEMYAGDLPAAPGTSVLNFNKGKTRAGHSLLALASDGSGTVKLGNGSTAAVDYALDILAYWTKACTATITVTNPGVATGTVNAAFSQTFTGSGGTGTLTFTTASPLPSGMSLAANGTLSGTPTQSGTFPIVVTATDANGCKGTGATYNLVIACQTITVTNPGVNTGTAGSFFSQTFTQTGGIGPTTTFSTPNALPVGMSLAANGVLSGTPTQTGVFLITVTATDANGCTGAGATYTLTINCQTITVTKPATTTGTAGTPFSQTFTQTGAIGGATFTTASTLPTGLFLAANGTLSGTPTQTGTFPIVVTVTDANGCTGTSTTYNLTINCQIITVTNPGVTTATANTFFSQTFTQAGAIGTATFTTASTLPAGTNLAANGTLSGTPTQTGSFPIVVMVTDANGCVGLGATYTLVVSCQTYSVEPTGLAPATSGVAYPDVTFSAPGGIGAVTFTFTGTLPTGMNLTGGVLSGTPTQTGSFPITVKGTDANGCTAQRDYILVVSCPSTPITLSPASLPEVAANAPFPATQFTASGGTGPYTFQQVGALPNGMQFLTDTLSGTPTQTGAFPITVTATDAGGCVGSQDYVITVTCNGVTITVAPPTIPSAPAGAAYAPVTFTASGGTGPYTFARTGALPPGMSFVTDTLSGTPTQQGTFPITITATDANGCVGSTSYSLVVTCPSITVTNPGVTTGTVNTFFTQTFTQSGGQGAVTFTTSSTLPAGMNLSTGGVLSGTPTQSGTFPIVVKVTDANGCTGTGATYTLVISCQTITVTNPAVSTGVDGAAFAQTFTQSGAVGTPTFSLASGSLPAGWSLTSAGVLANATPTPVAFSITVKVTDANGCTGTGALYTVTILPKATDDTYAPPIVGNTSIDTSTGTVFSVLTNDSAGATATVVTPPANGTVVLAPTGTFTYTPNRGYQGPDSFTYSATVSGIPSAPATVNLTVAGVVWFVNDNAGACSASCDGRLTNPYQTLAAFQTDNNGAGSNPKIGDRIFIYESPIAYTGPVTLQNGQRIIGQDFTGNFATAIGIAVPDTTVNAPVMNSGNGVFTVVTNGVAANAINLVTDGSVFGLTATASSGVAISQAVAPPAVGSAPLGTTTLTDVVISTTGTGTALKVLSTTGTLNFTSGSITASGSNSVSAVFIQGGTSAITIGVPIVSTGAGNVSVSQRGIGATTTFNGPVTMTGAAGGIAVSSPTGASTTTFNNLVQLGTGGTRISGAGGLPALSVNHSGTGSTTAFATLAVFSSGITGVLAQNGGALNISAGTVDVVNGRAFQIDGSPGTMSLGVTLTGITASGAGGGPGISLSAITGSFQNSTSTSITGASTQGILISGSGALVNFGTTTVSGSGSQGILVGTTTGNVIFGDTTINGGTDGVSLQNNSNGTRTFGTLAIGNTAPPSGIGFLHAVGGGNVTVNGAATIQSPGGLGVSVEGLSGTQSINFISTLSVVKGSGTAVSLGTATTNSATGTVNLGTLSVTAGSGTAILAGSGATSTPLSTQGSGVVSATNGPAINAQNTFFTASFGSVSSTNSTTQGITLTGANGNLTMNGGSITGSAGTAFNLSGGAANVTYAGTITQNAAQFAVAATSMTGGTKTFSGLITSITNGKGISLTTNTGATIAFTGGMTLSTGANPAFTATGGGTVNVSGANTVTTTTGTAVNLSGVGGAQSFTKVSANGAVNGISLSSTTGSFTVTGDGTNNASGGLIQNTTGDGVLLSNAQSVSLTSMSIQSTAHSGVKGSNNVQSFSFVNGTINNSGTASGTGDSNIAFNAGAYAPTVGNEKNLTGAVTITGSTLTNAFYHGIDIFQFDGTITNLNVSNNTITSSTSTATTKGSGIRIVGFGSASTVASVSKASIGTNTITNFPSDAGILFLGGNSTSTGAPAGTYGTDLSTNAIAITNNIISGQSAANQMGTQGINTGVAGKGTGFFRIANNSVTNVKGIGIGIAASGLTTYTAAVTGNTIVAHNTVGSAGIGGGTTNSFSTADTPTFDVNIGNNTISQTNGNGILVNAFSATGHANVRILSNNVSAPTANSGTTYGIRVAAGNATSVDDAVCLEISGNTTAGDNDGAGTIAPGIGLRKQGTNPTVNDFGIVGLPGGSTSTPNVENYINSQNPGSVSGSFGVGGTALISATSGFTTCVEPGGF